MPIQAASPRGALFARSRPSGDVGRSADTAMNTTTFPIFRELYNVFVTSQVVGTSADPNLVNMFVGTGSALCSNAGIIRAAGFEPLAGTQATETCGLTSPQERAYANG
jgi:hypothetical protein